MSKFLDMFDEYLCDDERWDRKSHYASDAAACRRQLAYRWRNEPFSDPPTAGNYLKMKFGKAAELIVEDGLRWMVEKGKIKAWEKQTRVEVQIEGLEKPVVMKMDFVITDLDGRVIILEVKSGFGRGVKDVQQKGRPKDDHLFQTFLYVRYGPSKEAVIAYVARDNGYRHEFGVWLDDEGRLLLNGVVLGTAEAGIEYMVRRLKVVEEAMKTGVLPARDFVVAIKNGEIKDQFQHQNVVYKSAWQCSYCSFKSTCWGEVVPRYASGNNAEMFAGKSAEED